MSKDLTALLSAQRDIHGRISRTVDNLKKLGASNITLSTTETRTDILDKLWDKFESHHEQIRTAYGEDFFESEYVRTDFFDLVENAYVQQRSILADYANQFRPASAQDDPAGESNGERPPKTALPRIKLKQFSGEFEDWPSFRDLFLSVIGENSSISNIERFHYLKSSLQGPAEKLIRPLAVTGDNYEKAWALLVKNYENKKELARSNFSTFTALQKMKSDSSEELSRIYHAVTGTVNGQESIGRPIATHGMDLLNHLVVELFDPKTRLEWEDSTSNSTDLASHEELIEFITKRIRTLNAAKPKTTKVSADPPRTAKSHLAKPSTSTSRSTCVLCKGQHNVMMCDDFKAKSANDRKAVIETNRLCYNCFGTHSVSRCQSLKNCSTCNSRHHSMLHQAYATAKATEVSTLSAVRQDEDRKAILLATARVMVADRHGDQHHVRALIDQGSEVSLISEALAQRLRLQRSRTAVAIFGVGHSRSGPNRGKVTLQLASRVTGAKCTVVAFIMPRLSLYQGTALKGTVSWPHIAGLPLADPRFMDSDPVELLLGAEVCSVILEEGFRKGNPRDPVAQCTTLGWIISGGIGVASLHGHCSSLQCTADHELNELVQRFWEQEKETSSSAALTPDEQRCEEHFMRTHTRTASGRYVVRLPFRTPPSDLMDTRQPAERLLTAMERKGQKDPRFNEFYRAFMKEYADLGHMELVTSPADEATTCYLPHHGVLREASTSTKLRVVFNGSQRTRSGESLNSHLQVGANLLPALANVLMRWRWHRYALVTDIEKMYRQIIVSPEDRGFQQILWRHEVTDNVREYRLNTVTYGLACAPFLAIRTLRQLSDDEASRFPHGSRALRHDCYVDDIVTGANTKSDAINLQFELRKLCMAGGFPLKKWAANFEEILAGIPLEHRLQTPTHSWKTEGHSTLGVHWHVDDDTFTFAIHPRSITELTKRSVLAETARLFDPLGWLAPVVMRAKIWIQSAWLQRIDWDSPLPQEDARRWQRFLEELPHLGCLRISRWLGSGDDDTALELHGFADASERGYAAAVYLRVSLNRTTTVHLLTAKSKVAPIKPVSLPRLELCAAALLATLSHSVRTVLNLLSAPVYLWSDSTVTLHWIQGHASRWKTYVANRVSHIQQLLPEAQWRHIPGRDNPADCASRGIAPHEIVGHHLWWTGPSWLKLEKESWPNETFELPSQGLLELRVTASSATAKAITEPELLLRYSSLPLLLRVTALCLRWRRPKPNNRAQEQCEVPLIVQPADLDLALFRWLHIVQALHYPNEVSAISKNQPLSPRSPLLKLNPFLDANDVLRVGGRLKHSVLSHDERHPMIVPPHSKLAQLLIESCHRRTLHGGVQLTLGMLRLRFWIPQGRAVVKRLLHRCPTCTRWRAVAPQPPMGNLPEGRVTPARPFLRTGVDYAGPIHIRTSKGRGHKSHKAFIAIFICMCTKAVHLEVVSDYSTEAFLAALRRFTARRGLCTDLFSDCGTNFVGADRQLRELLRASSPDGRRIAHVAATEGIRWHFNPPAAPHFGGLWEAAVKSMKHHLRRIIGDTTLTFEEMSTFLAQVEACLNSRPLQALSDDPDDISALTPGHLLIGAPLLAVPEPSLRDKADSSLSRWQHLQKMRDHFWERWSREYLHSLAARPKWLKPDAAPQVGALCLIRSEITPPSKWPLARITKLHPGDDNVTRVVTVRTSTSEFVRPLTKIVLLPGITAPASPQEDV